MLQVRCLRSLAEIEKFGPDWQELERVRAAHVDWFQTSEWCLNWLRHHCDDEISPRVLVLREKGKLVAVLPMMVKLDRFGLRILRMLGDPHTQYAGVLCRNETLGADHLKALRAALVSMDKADVAVITLVPAGSLLTQLLPEASEIGSLRNTASVLDLGKFRTSAEYAASLNKARRRSRSRRKKLIAEMGQVGFRILRPQHADYPRMIERSMALKQAWLTRTGRVSVGLSKPNHRNFLASIDSSGLLFELSVAGEPIALELGFLRNRHFYSYLGSFDWKWRELSPGKALMDQIVDWLIDNGAVAYDFLAHPSAYKDSWSDTSIPLQSHVVEITKRGSIYARCWINSTRPALKRAMAAIPDDYRAGLHFVMKQDMPFVA